MNFLFNDAEWVSKCATGSVGLTFMNSLNNRETCCLYFPNLQPLSGYEQISTWHKLAFCSLLFCICASHCEFSWISEHRRVWLWYLTADINTQGGNTSFLCSLTFYISKNKANIRGLVAMASCVTVLLMTVSYWSDQLTVLHINIINMCVCALGEGLLCVHSFSLFPGGSQSTLHWSCWIKSFVSVCLDMWQCVKVFPSHVHLSSERALIQRTLVCFYLCVFFVYRTFLLIVWRLY